VVEETPEGIVPKTASKAELMAACFNGEGSGL
jgi:hypothetical protein